jgi:hypothetical protein
MINYFCDLVKSLQMKIFLTIAIIAAFTVLAISLTVRANSLFWEITYPSTIKVDANSTVLIRVTTSEDIDLHVAFKSHFDQRAGNFWTGDWTYEEQKVFVPAGTNNKLITFTFKIPYELWVERLLKPEFRPQFYYFFVFSTTPNGSYGTGSENVGPRYLPHQVIFPGTNLEKFITTSIGMLKAKVLSSSDLSEEARSILFGKLVEANIIVDEAFDLGIKSKFCPAKILLGDFIDEVKGLFPFWFRAAEAINHAELVIFFINKIADCPEFCAGITELTLNRDQICLGGEKTTATASGFLECTNKRVFFRLNGCNGKTLGFCTLGGTKCSQNLIFNDAGTHQLFACVDKNNDGDFDDLGEQDSLSVHVSMQFCRVDPPLTNATANETIICEKTTTNCALSCKSCPLGYKNCQYTFETLCGKLTGTLQPGQSIPWFTCSSAGTCQLIGLK